MKIFFVYNWLYKLEFVNKLFIFVENNFLIGVIIFNWDVIFNFFIIKRD